MASKKTPQRDNLQNIESALTKTEQFIEDYQTKIMYGIGCLVLIVIGYLAFTRFFIQPKENEAKPKREVVDKGKRCDFAQKIPEFGPGFLDDQSVDFREGSGDQRVGGDGDEADDGVGHAIQPD